MFQGFNKSSTIMIIFTYFITLFQEYYKTYILKCLKRCNLNSSINFKFITEIKSCILYVLIINYYGDNI